MMGLHAARRPALHPGIGGGRPRRLLLVRAVASGTDAADADAEADAASPATEAAAPAFAAAARQQAQDQPLQPSTLYLVSTPLGNLSDLSLRALGVLSSASAVLCEDTRRTQRLLARYGLLQQQAPPRLLSYHAHNEKAREEQILDMLRAGESLAMVSDAGTPGVADPGAALVARIASAGEPAGLSIVPVPGPCAAIAALVASGLPTERFTFVGFLPPKAAARRAELRELSTAAAASAAGTLVFYVSPHAAAATLQDCAAELGPQRRCCLARELTKTHEEFLRGTLESVGAELGRRAAAGEAGARGEMVLVVEGGADRRTVAKEALERALEGKEEGGKEEDGGAAATAAETTTEAPPPLDVRARMAELLRQGEGSARASKQLAKELGVGRRQLYELAERMRREEGGGDDRRGGRGR
jgi:16S rRNA (cytidine1402-2'-O)-methyltransferase